MYISYYISAKLICKKIFVVRQGFGAHFFKNGKNTIFRNFNPSFFQKRRDGKSLTPDPTASFRVHYVTRHKRQ